MGELVPKELVVEAEQRIYTEVLELLDREIEKSKDNGDLDTAEVFELIRAKVKAHSEKRSASSD